MLDEEMGRGTLPLGIRGREVGADVACPAGGKQRVCQRMQAHIGVGMTRQPSRMRNLYPTKGYVVAFNKSMYVVAVTRAHIRQTVHHSSQSLVGQREVTRPRDL